MLHTLPPLLPLRRRLLAAALVLLVPAQAPAAAGEPPASASAPGAPPTPVEPEELPEAPAVEVPPARRTVVTATRKPLPVEEQPRAVSVVTREDLGRRPARSTPEALLEQEGVFLQKTNQGGGAPIIRGLYGQQVLLLVDGVRINNTTVRAGPNQFLNTVDPFLVEQLEVLRGPGSVLYGSDALGGVVNVRTFWPRFAREATPHAALRAQAGSADASLQGHLRAGLSLEHTALAGALTARDFNDLRGGAQVGVQRYTGYEEGDAALKLRHRFAPGTQLLLQYQAVRQRNAPRPDRSVPGDFRRFSRQERDFLHARLQSTGLGPLRRGALELSVHRQGDVTDRFRLRRDRLERDAVDVWTYGLRAEAELPGLSPLPGAPAPLLGAELFYDRVFGAGAAQRPLSTDGEFRPTPEDARYPGIPTALAAGLFALLTSAEQGGLTYHAGARLQLNRTHLPEDARLNSLFADAAQPPPVFPAATVNALGLAGEVGLRQRVLPGWLLLLNLGSGFRAPNVDDYLRMGAEGPGFLIPGRDLRAEQSYTAEVGTRVGGERAQAQLFYAFTAIPGLVGNVPTTVDGQARTPEGIPYLVRQNRERARIHSLEGAASVRVLPQLTLAAHATWTLTEQRRQDLTRPDAPTIVEPLSRTPPLNGLVRATWEPTETLFTEGVLRWALAQRALSAADRLDNRICPESPGCAGTPGWTALHLRGGARLSRQLSVALTLQNLLDATYRPHGSGVEEPGRSVILSLEAAL